MDVSGTITLRYGPYGDYLTDLGDDNGMVSLLPRGATARSAQQSWAVIPSGDGIQLKNEETGRTLTAPKPGSAAPVVTAPAAPHDAVWVVTDERDFVTLRLSGRDDAQLTLSPLRIYPPRLAAMEPYGDVSGWVAGEAP